MVERVPVKHLVEGSIPSLTATNIPVRFATAEVSQMKVLQLRCRLRAVFFYQENTMIYPSNDRVLINPIDLEAISGGGIVITNMDDRRHGKVMSIGPGKQNASGHIIPITQCKVGDTVIYGNVASTIEDRLDNGDKCLLVVSEAIVAVLK